MLKIKILLLIPIFLLSCLENTITCTTGDDNVVIVLRKVDNFNSLTSGTSGSVMVIQGGAQELAITSFENLLPLISTTVTNENLFIGFNQMCIENVLLEVIATMEDIESLNTLSSAQILSLNPLDLDNLSVFVGGSGGMLLNGQVETLDVIIDGSGDFEAFNLETDTCKVTIQGFGNVFVKVNKLLIVTILGSGNVTYKGNPQIILALEVGSGMVIDGN